jgi:hypothetical protein
MSEAIANHPLIFLLSALCTFLGTIAMAVVLFLANIALGL